MASAVAEGDRVTRHEPGGSRVSPPDTRKLKDIDTTRAHPARTYDYLLGGKNNFAADRDAVDKVLKVFPAARTTARENRKFLGRAVAYVVAEGGVRQFLDIGTGLPAANNTHEVAQAAAPDCHVVYVDNDPLVLVHARALLTGKPTGRTAYIEADLRDPEKILGHQVTLDVLDLSQPIALMLVSILHFLTDEDDPGGVVDTLLSALPPGSYLVASHLTADYDPEGTRAMSLVAQQAGTTFLPRTDDEFAAFFAGLELVDPGVVAVSDWRPDSTGLRPTPAEGGFYSAVGRKA
jgi:hypothetical protein